MSLFAEIFDVTLLATIGLIFIVTVTGAYFRSRRRDVCLSSFNGFPVTLERTNGKVVWGVMDLESSGLELQYRSSVQDANHVESSYLLYASEYEDIQAIYRYVDELDGDDKARREKDLRRSFHPGLFVRISRSIQHFFALAADAMSEVLALVMGRLRKPAGRYITDTGEAHLKKLGNTMIGSVGRAFDPLLERLVGQKVVFELVEGEEVHEHVGIFKNYSADFIEVLDVQFPQKQSLPLLSSQRVQARFFSATFVEGKLKVKNHTSQPLLLHSLKFGDEEELLNVVVDGDEEVEIFPGKEFEEAELSARVVRELDMIVPRTHCMVRHRAERYEPELLPEIIFDLGVLIAGSALADAQEKRLRQELAVNPNAALAALNLGAILVQKQEYEEADKWLSQAYRVRFSLPDNGKRARMLLNELRRRRAKAPAQSALITATESRSVAVTMDATREPQQEDEIRVSVNGSSSTDASADGANGSGGVNVSDRGTAQLSDITPSRQ